MILGKVNILLIEDDLTDVTLIKRQIEKVISKPKVLHVSGFQEFIDAMELFKPDIIISDYQLKGFTGLEVLRYLQKSNNEIPFLFVTGTIHDEELAENTILTNADGYILKGNINQLHEKLDVYFQKILVNKSN